MQSNDSYSIAKFSHAFQFPSNGKVYAKTPLPPRGRVAVTVSIPFKREGICKAQATWHNKHKWVFVFQFPSNGKVYAKKVANAATESLNTLDQFQFPSNGKVYAKTPNFASSPGVAPYTQNQTRTVQDIFSDKKLTQKSHKPL